MGGNFDWRDGGLLGRWVGELSYEWWLPERGEQGRGGGMNGQDHGEMVVHWEAGEGGNISSGGWLSKRGEQREEQEELVW